MNISSACMCNTCFRTGLKSSNILAISVQSVWQRIAQWILIFECNVQFECKELLKRATFLKNRKIFLLYEQHSMLDKRIVAFKSSVNPIFFKLRDFLIWLMNLWHKTVLYDVKQFCKYKYTYLCISIYRT